MEPDLYKRITPIIHYKNKHSSLCRQTSHNTFQTVIYRKEYLQCKTQQEILEGKYHQINPR
jgi:hypothetical protein